MSEFDEYYEKDTVFYAGEELFLKHGTSLEGLANAGWRLEWNGYHHTFRHTTGKVAGVPYWISQIIALTAADARKLQGQKLRDILEGKP